MLHMNLDLGLQIEIKEKFLELLSKKKKVWNVVDPYPLPPVTENSTLFLKKPSLIKSKALFFVKKPQFQFQSQWDGDTFVQKFGFRTMDSDFGLRLGTQDYELRT